jgi:hypothetical protein
MLTLPGASRVWFRARARRSRAAHVAARLCKGTHHRVRREILLEVDAGIPLERVLESASSVVDALGSREPSPSALPARSRDTHLRPMPWLRSTPLRRGSGHRCVRRPGAATTPRRGARTSRRRPALPAVHTMAAEARLRSRRRKRDPSLAPTLPPNEYYLVS